MPRTCRRIADSANRRATAHVDGTRTSAIVNGSTTPYVRDCAADLPLLARGRTNRCLSDPSGSLLMQLDAGNTPTYYLDDTLRSVPGTAETAGTLT